MDDSMTLSSIGYVSNESSIKEVSKVLFKWFFGAWSTFLESNRFCFVMSKSTNRNNVIFER